MQFDQQFEEYNFPKLGYIKIPKIPIPPEDIARLNLAADCSSNDYLIALANEGFEAWLKKGKIPAGQESIYKDRLNYEVGEINRLLFTNYILLVYHMMNFCRKNDIANSPSRGSCGGSLLLAVINCIQIDPIKHDLLFERFISAARTEVKEFDGEIYIASASLPDIDTDSDQTQKDKVLKF